MISDWPSTGFVLSELARDPRLKTQGDPVRQFEMVFGRAFFIRFTGSLKVRLPAMATPALRLKQEAAESETTGDTLVLVHPVARRHGSEHPFVSIGRIDKNDICLGDESVSKFHAYIKESSGLYVLQDARSRNGTTLEGVAVPGRGMGDPMVLKSGQAIRFGGVDGVFLDVRQTVELISRMTRG